MNKVPGLAPICPQEAISSTSTQLNKEQEFPIFNHIIFISQKLNIIQYLVKYVVARANIHIQMNAEGINYLGANWSV